MIIFWVQLAVLAVAGGLSAIVTARTPVGLLSDDALNLLAAQSLLQGRYAALQLPDAPALTSPLPGFPLLLAPFLPFVPHDFELLKWLSWALTLAAGVLLVRLIRPWMPSWAACAAAALFLWNAETLRRSSVVMAEPLFVCLWIGMLLGLRRSIRQPSKWIDAGVALGLAWAVLVRPQGVAFIPGVIAMSLTAPERRDRLLAITLPAIFAAAGWHARNAAAETATAGYAEFLSRSIHVPFTDYAHHLLQVAGNIWPGVWVSSGSPASFLLALIGLILSVAGIRRAWLDHPDERPVLAALIVSAAGYLLIHLAWRVSEPRYFWPLQPFLIAAAIRGGLAGPTWIWRFAGGALAAAILFTAGAFFAAMAGAPPAREPALVYAPIARHTPPQAYLLAANSPSVFLYTGRHAVGALASEDPDRFGLELLDRSIGWIWVHAGDGLLQITGRGDANPFWRRVRSWTAARPDVFTPVDEDPGGAWRLYRVQLPASAREAQALYVQGLEALNRSDRKTALERLEQSVRRYPGLSRAWNLLGVVRAMRGERAPARSALEKAVQLDPDFSDPVHNLKRLKAAGTSQNL